MHSFWRYLAKNGLSAVTDFIKNAVGELPELGKQAVAVGQNFD